MTVIDVQATLVNICRKMYSTITNDVFIGNNIATMSEMYDSMTLLNRVNKKTLLLSCKNIIFENIFEKISYRQAEQFLVFQTKSKYNK